MQIFVRLQSLLGDGQRFWWSLYLSAQHRMPARIDTPRINNFIDRRASTHQVEWNNLATSFDASIFLFRQFSRAASSAQLLSIQIPNLFFFSLNRKCELCIFVPQWTWSQDRWMYYIRISLPGHDRMRNESHSQIFHIRLNKPMPNGSDVSENNFDWCPKRQKHNVNSDRIILLWPQYCALLSFSSSPFSSLVQINMQMKCSTCIGEQLSSSSSSALNRK